jgi:hypothetical protein
MAGVKGQGLNQPPRMKVVMSKNGETITQQPRVEETPPLPASGEQQQRDPHTSTEGPLLSGLVPPGSLVTPGTVTKFPQDFNSEKVESDRSDPSIGSDTGVDPTRRSFGSDADMEVDYNGTSSDEESPTSKDQPMASEPKSTQPRITEHISQSIQHALTDSINQNNQPTPIAPIN